MSRWITCHLPGRVAARQPLVALVAAHDDAVEAIVTDPCVATHADSAPVQAYLALFHPDSPFTRGPLEVWGAEAARGRRYRRLDGNRMYDSVVTSVEIRSGVTVVMRVITIVAVRIVGASGETLETQRCTCRSEVVAVRHGERWLLDRLVELGGQVARRCSPGHT